MGIIIPDFENSRLNWEVSAGGSLGFFSLDGIVRFHQPGAPVEEFVLTAMVLAGNMYARGSLVKQPSYLYQMVAGEGEYRILRTATPGQTQAAFLGEGFHDSMGRVDDLFSFLNIHIQNKSTTQIRRIDLTEGSNPASGRLVGCVDLVEGKVRAEVFFPIRHWNQLPLERKFQVETGPVLWPQIWNSVSEGIGVGGLLPAFLHFGNENRVEVSLDYPCFIRSFEHSNRFKSVDCSIQVFEVLG